MFISRYCRQIENKSLSLWNKTMSMEDINRIKMVLFEKKRTSRWLAGQLGVTPSTVSKWCTNTTQPSLEMLFKISELLQVPIQDLVRKQNF